MAEGVHLRAVVKGYVQGVGFRQFVLWRARDLGLKGYVRNLRDGRAVEVEAEGEKQKLEELLSLLRVGPSAASVETVEASWLAPLNTFVDFEVRH